MYEIQAALSRFLGFPARGQTERQRFMEKSVFFLLQTTELLACRQVVPRQDSVCLRCGDRGSFKGEGRFHLLSAQTRLPKTRCLTFMGCRAGHDALGNSPSLPGKWVSPGRWPGAAKPASKACSKARRVQGLSALEAARQRPTGLSTSTSDSPQPGILMHSVEGGPGYPIL